MLFKRRLPRATRTLGQVSWLALLLAPVAVLGCRDPDGVGAATSAPGSVGQPAPSASEENLAHDPADEAQAEVAPAALPTPTPGGLGKETRALSEALTAHAKRLDTWAGKGKGHARVALLDAERGVWLSEYRADEVENPASTQKVLTAAAALELLGPAYTFRTELRGAQQGGRIERLCFVGGGAPDLTTADAYRLSRILVEGGLREVGEIVVDQSRFDENFVPPAFEQQPEEWAAFRAPVSALALDRNTVELDVQPTVDGEAALTWFVPPAASRASGSVKTGGADSGDRVTWSVQAGATPPGLDSKVGGSLAQGRGRQRYFRRLADPRLVPGWALQEMLSSQGVKVTGKVSLGSAEGAGRLVQLESAPLSVLVRALGKESDNFTAEMLLIALSASESGPADAKSRAAAARLPWSTERGLRALRGWLGARGLSAEGLVLKNGSGLFDANRLSPRVLVRTLRYMLDRPGSSAEFMAQLAVGGQDGTLRSRFNQGPLAQRVRAKTGTLRDVIALSGYVLRADGRAPLVFSILLSGSQGRQTEARRLVDELVADMAAQSGP